MLSKQDILQGGVKRETVQVEELGGEVHIKGISVRDRVEFGRLYADDESAEAAPYPADVWLVLRSVVDEDGDRLFSEADAEQVMDAPNAVVQKITQACLELNGMAEGAVEDAEGN